MSTTTVVQESTMASKHQQSLREANARPPVQIIVNYWNSEDDHIPAMDKSMPFLDRKMAFVRYQMDHEDRQTVAVHDMRGREDEFSLGKQGFQLVRRQAKTQSFANDEEIKTSYYPEVETLMKEITGAHKIHIYDHHIRHLSFQASLTAPSDPSSLDLPGPVRTVHIDDTAACARNVITKNFPPSEATHLLAHPFSLINIWRPLKPVQKDPLGLIDARTVQASDRIEARLPTPDGEDNQVRKGERHQWWWVSGQGVDECVKEGFWGVPHSSFEVGGEGIDRESVEVRCLCFFEEEKE
ncbi:hypothetical protein PRZ48_006859 [Zasmidium cellare]|uniref:Uncharacterized protein n=1 Tax=Zasmidium cellare TaxID=395010 RepID=A0ABR0EJ27_ZASCE|nr:hypothetical protein PRZ48_006859 [Zasmidium cellare]